MAIRCETNHRSLNGERTLTIRVHNDAPRNRARRVAEVHFNVPRDFHCHNDSVAAALMTLIGHVETDVQFNFPISAYCAEILRNYYRLTDVGPVDASLEPRRPGSRLALNFSGGLDSSALRALLEVLLPGEFLVLSNDFGGTWAYELQPHATWRPDFICRTDFRRRGLRNGRFMGAAALLFADYLDLGTVTSGHIFSQELEAVERNIDGHTPIFVHKELTYRAGGLQELHILRGVDEVGVLRILMRLAPQRVEAALRGSSEPYTTRNLARGLALRLLYELEGMPLPPAVAAYELKPHPYYGGALFAGGAPTLFVIKHRGEAAIDALSSPGADLRQFDFSFLADLSMDYLVKYNTNLTQYVPAHLRRNLLTLLAQLGVAPFNERDWQEIEAVRTSLFPMLVTAGLLPGSS